MDLRFESNRREVLEKAFNDAEVEGYKATDAYKNTAKADQPRALEAEAKAIKVDIKKIFDDKDVCVLERAQTHFEAEAAKAEAKAKENK